LGEGTKPLTPFGIFHHLENQKSLLSTSTNETYPDLRSDLKTLEDRRGLWSFVFDTLFDLDIIAGERSDDQPRRETQVDDVESNRNGEEYNTNPREGAVVQGMERRRMGSYQSSIQGSPREPRAHGEGSDTDTDGSLDVPLLDEDEQRPWVAWSTIDA
jgi:hypothetical protein